MKFIPRLIAASIALFPVSLFAQGLFPSPFIDDRHACTQFTDQVSSAQQQAINVMMGSPEHRRYHLLWHVTRDSWDRVGNMQGFFRQFDSAWGGHARVCPSPIQNPNNVAGEEFLLMHHLMIDSLRQYMSSQQLPCIAPWFQVPEVNDPVWPAPYDPNDTMKGEDVGYLVRNWAEWFMSPQYLQGRTLSEVGYTLEYSIHNVMHARWSAPASQSAGLAQLGDNAVVTMLTTNDYTSPQVNWLGSPYSSQVNPVFWKLHGWIDRVIEQWLRANSYLSISFSCNGDPTCYEWRSRWNGVSSEPTGGSGGHEGHGSGMVSNSRELRRLGQLIGNPTFRNEDFANKLREPIGGSVPGGPIQRPEEDPRYYVETSGGPCR